MATSEDIRTKRLLITPFNKEHLTERYVRWLNDPDLMRYSEQRHRVHTIESCLKYWQSFEGTPNYFWAIEEVEEGIGHIGNINAYIDEINFLADVGILIGDKHAKNKGYGTETLISVCNYLFLKVWIRKLTAGTLSVNIPMLKLMRRIGMVEDGIRKRHYVFSDQEEDMVHMALFKEKWISISSELALFQECMHQDKR